MAQTLEFKENRGTPDAHRKVAEKRLNQAKEAL